MVVVVWIGRIEFVPVLVLVTKAFRPS